MKKIGKISISYLALVAVIAFNFLAIHHHHHEMAVPIIVELLGSNGDDADSDASNTCHTLVCKNAVIIKRHCAMWLKYTLRKNVLSLIHLLPENHN